MMRLSFWTILLSVILLPITSQAQDASEKTIAVVAAKGAGGPNLQGPVNRFVVPGLKATLNVLPPKAVQKAAVKAKVKGKALSTPAGVKKVGERAGATHVVLIEGVREVAAGGKRGKPTFSAAVSVIDVATGDVTFTATYALQGRALTKKIAEMLVGEVTGSLSAPPAPPAEPPAEQAEPVAAALEPPPPPPDAPVAPEAPPATGETASAPAEGEAQPPAEVASPEPAAEQAEPVAVDVTVGAESETTPQGGVRPALEVSAGAIMLQRQGSISSSTGIREPLSYEGPLPGAYLQLRLFPLAFGGSGRWFEGLGLHLDGDFVQVKTTLDSTNESSTNTITALSGGVSYRLVFWASPTAPDFTLNAGYSYFAFPLPASFGFPGVRYRAAYVGGTFTIPLGTEMVALVAGGSYMPSVEVSRRIAGLGEHDGTTAYRAEGGLRLRFGRILLIAMGRVDGYAAKFTGEPTDANLAASFEIADAEVTDAMFGGTVTVGMAF